VLSIGVFPLDFWLFSQAAWRRIRPDAAILTESELWPEHLHQARRRKVPAYLVNARISETSFRRYRKVPTLARRMLEKFRGVYAASDLDRARLIELGCPAGRIATSGSIKFDVPIGGRCTEEEQLRLKEALGFGGARPFVLLGSSTWPGEEAALLRTQKAAIAEGIDCRLLLVPRHAERAPELAALLKAQGLDWHQRSTMQEPEREVRIHLADTTGELSRLTQAADLAFVGKSLPPNAGGQTPIEAAGLGVPILMGPNMGNFKDVAQSLIRAGAAQQVDSAEALREAVLRLAADSCARENMSVAGTAWHRANRGSSERIAAGILQSLSGMK